jgi:hypothetical protein
MWGCGMNPERWTPATTGASWTIPAELIALDRELGSGGKIRDNVSVLSGFDVSLAARPGRYRNLRQPGAVDEPVDRRDPFFRTGL